uniref:Uncharacterized protein n=1 Tax=Arundo donax TaxID=35708 RepID=A0A0A8YTU3_ARUDO
MQEPISMADKMLLIFDIIYANHLT